MIETTLHLICGKIASGKSTLAATLCQNSNTIIIAQDAWMSVLYPENKTVADYLYRAPMLRTALKPHIITLLTNGLSVVLDFPANSPDSRSWMYAIINEANCEHQLHFLDFPDDLCRTRLRTRNASGTHEYQVSDDEFNEITALFVPPQESEGFNIIRYV